MPSTSTCATLVGLKMLKGKDTSLQVALFTIPLGAAEGDEIIVVRDGAKYAVAMPQESGDGHMEVVLQNDHQHKQS